MGQLPWLKLWTRVVDSPAFNPPAKTRNHHVVRSLYRLLWTDFLIYARMQPIEDPRLVDGQLFTNMGKLQRASGLTRYQIRLFLDRLVGEQMIKKEVVGNDLLITIHNWRNYQDGPMSDDEEVRIRGNNAGVVVEKQCYEIFKFDREDDR